MITSFPNWWRSAPWAPSRSADVTALIDFTLSSMANAGIDNVSVIVRKNYHSLMDHLGAGREWDLTRKRGGLDIVPPFAERSVGCSPVVWTHWTAS